MGNEKIDASFLFTASFINDLFVLGVNSLGGQILKEGLKTCSGEKFLNILMKYFEKSDNPIDEFLNIIDCGGKLSSGKNKINSLAMCLKMDETSTPFIALPFTGEGARVLNCALALHELGLKNNADTLFRVAIGMILKELFNNELSLIHFEHLAETAISKSQSERAKKPRSPHYHEALEIIRLTWDKYPCASKTALLEALSVHYYKKVSRNALEKWISQSGLRPPKPKKYSSFELVIPQ